MSKSQDILAERLEAELKRREKGKGDLAGVLGISRPTLDAYLKGKKPPTLDTLDRIAIAIGKEPWQLIGPEAPPTVEELTQVIQNQERRIRELESRQKQAEYSPLVTELLRRIPTDINELEMSHLFDEVTAILNRRRDRSARPGSLNKSSG